MALQQNALVTLSRVKKDLGIETADTSEDSLLTNYINTASDQIEAISNRKFKASTYTHRLTGQDTNHVILEQFPATSLIDVNNDDKWAYPTQTDIEVDTEVAIDKETFLVRRGIKNKWSPMPMSIRVTYTAGYSTIPEGLQQACVEYVRFLYFSQSTRRLGTSSRAKGNENVTFDDGIPSLIRFLVRPYSREQWIKRAYQLNGVMLFEPVEKPEANVIKR